MSQHPVSLGWVRRASVGQIITLAPDDASLRAARLLATPGPWFDAGCDDRAVWGSCRGSAREPYSVSCDVGELAYRCTCPSRKQPCKHVLSLLLLWASGSAVVSAAVRPAEVAAWIATRPAPPDGATIADSLSSAGHQDGSGNGEDSSLTVTGRRAPADPEAAGRRVAQRAARITAGMQELQLWLEDLLRHGFGWAQSQSYAFWDAMAARMVDAQAPAAAVRVRAMPGVVRSGEGWPSRLLGEVARLQLLAAGWSRSASLPSDVRADLRTAAGWPWPSDEVLGGERETDSWYVLARVADDEEHIRVQRTWLWGLRSGRPALLVDFARPGSAFAWELWPGEAMEASVARFPGSAPLRVLIAERLGDPSPAGRPPGWDDWAAVASARGRAAAADPFIDRWPVSVRDVVPVREDATWWAYDRTGASLPMDVDARAAWKLVAVSGGQPVQLLGEWSGDGITPLGAWVENRMVGL